MRGSGALAAGQSVTRWRRGGATTLELPSAPWSARALTAGGFQAVPAVRALGGAGRPSQRECVHNFHEHRARSQPRGPASASQWRCSSASCSSLKFVPRGTPRLTAMQS